MMLSRSLLSLVISILVMMVFVDLSNGGNPYADDKRCVKLCMGICLKLEVRGEFDECFATCKMYCKEIIRLCTNCVN